MSDLADLQNIQAKLARLGSVDLSFDGRWLNIGEAQGPAMLGKILQEIDDTVLPTTLTFQRDGAALQIDAAGRRLVRVLSVSGLGDAGATLENHTLSPEDSDAMQTLTKCATAFAELTGGASVHAEVLRGAPDGTNVGASLFQLEEAWGLRVELPEGDTTLQRLRSGLGKSVKAYILICDGIVDRFKGPKGLIAEIEDLVENRLMDFDEQRIEMGYDHSDPSLTVLQGAGPKAETLLVAIHGSEILIAFGAPELMIEGHKLWRLLA